MKTLLCPSVLLALSLNLFGQGIVAFDNGWLDAPVKRPDGTGAGAGVTAQLVLVTADGNLVPLTPTTIFHTSSPAAEYYVVAIAVIVPGQSPGTVVTLRMRAYTGTDFASSDLRGESADATVKLGGGDVPPTYLDGLQGFTLAAQGVGQPTLTKQPTNQSVSLGANLTLQVTAAGTAPLTYQWQFNSADILGATNRTLIITNTQDSNAGDYSAVVANLSGSTTSRLAHVEVDPTFTKVTGGNIVNDGGLSVGVAWVDYDEDDYLDLLVTNTSGTENFLYHNERNGAFKRITEGPIVRTPADFRAPAWADYDNDGHIDLYVASTGAYGPIDPWNFLFENNGDGTFTSLSSNLLCSLVGPNGESESSHWADYDRDGFLDLFVVRDGTDMLFHNNGDGSFARITNSPVVLAARDNYGAAWCDYDNDGYPDLFVASAFRTEADGLYHNNREGTFTRVTSGAIATGRSASSGPVWVDYNDDGLMDLFVANEDRPNFLYRNNGGGTFTKITTGALVNTYGATKSIWGDYDNDGFLDVFMPLRGGQHNMLFHNKRDGTFTRVTTGSPVHDGGNSVNTSWGDYDNDGFLDLVVANGAGDAVENNFLYRNSGNSNQWLKVRLIGTISNRSAIGAKIRVRAISGGGQPFWQMRELSDGAGPNGNTLIAHFGLGDAAEADVVRIEWPSGTVQEFHEVAAKQFLTIVEPSVLVASPLPSGTVKLILHGGKGFTYVFQASSDLENWTPIHTNTSSELTLEFEDADASKWPHRFYRAVLASP